MKKFLASKKAKAMITGLIANLIVGALTIIFKKELPPEIVEAILQIVAWGVVAIPTIFIGGQAYADGKSGGITSSTPPLYDRFGNVVELPKTIKE